MSLLRNGTVMGYSLGELTKSSGHPLEYADYKDEGCDLVPSCLSCPLPACRYDMPAKMAQGLLQQIRVKELLAAGHSTFEVADMLGINRRTVFRAKAYPALPVVG